METIAKEEAIMGTTDASGSPSPRCARRICCRSAGSFRVLVLVLAIDHSDQTGAFSVAFVQAAEDAVALLKAEKPGLI
jgi:hypothetical protein